jgi:hypothetical protein
VDSSNWDCDPHVFAARWAVRASLAAKTTGTEPVAAILAMTSALEAAVDPAQLAANAGRFREMCTLVWDTLLPFVVTGQVLPTGPSPGPNRAPHVVSFCVRGANRGDLVQSSRRSPRVRRHRLPVTLDQDGGVLASGGSACSSETGLPSHVLVAMCVPSAVSPSGRARRGRRATSFTAACVFRLGSPTPCRRCDRPSARPWSACCVARSPKVTEARHLTRGAPVAAVGERLRHDAGWPRTGVRT